MEKYAITSAADAKGKVSVRRVSDGKVARCKLSWLEQLTETEWVAKNKTKALRMDGLEWTTEG
jgi:hypothetical protein